MTDDEPYPSSYTDCTYSQWRVNEGTTLFTIKSSEKVGEFEFDYFRPQYQPGWKIKENGVEISTTSPGPKEAWPAPYTVAHAILSPPEPAKPDRMLKCVDSRKRGQNKWISHGRKDYTEEEARAKCAGYKYMSLECPTDKTKFEVWCANDLSGMPVLPDDDCKGKPTVKSLNNGQMEAVTQVEGHL